MHFHPTAVLHHISTYTAHPRKHGYSSISHSFLGMITESKQLLTRVQIWRLACIYFMVLHGIKPQVRRCYTLCVMYRIVSSHRAEYRDLSVASRSIICPSRRQRQIIIDLQDTDKSRYFAITEFNNCFIIRSPSLRKHPFVLALRRWGCFAFLRANVPSGEERGETVVFADYRSPSLFFNEYLREAKRSAIFHLRAISRRRIRKA